MEFRQATERDIQFCADHGLSGTKFLDSESTAISTVVLEHEGNILGMGGIIKITEATAWGWVELTEYTNEKIYTVFRTITEWLIIVCRHYKILRLQTFINPEIAKNVRLVRHLGFERESTMPNFLGKNKDADLYVRMME